MDANEFLAKMGWPADRADEAGQARWSGASADGISMVQATLSRDSQKIEARVETVGMEGSAGMLLLQANVEGGLALVSSSTAGEPPEEIPAEDAAHLFAFMSKGLGAFKFASTGPLVLPSKAKLA